MKIVINYNTKSYYEDIFKCRRKLTNMGKFQWEIGCVRKTEYVRLIICGGEAKVQAKGEQIACNNY